MIRNSCGVVAAKDMSISSSARKSESGTDLRDFVLAGGGRYIENSEFRVAQFQSDRRHFKRLELLMGWSIDNVGGFPHKKCFTTSNYMRG